MEATDLLERRRSFGKLGEPAPSGEVLERILRQALRAPDHGALRPWKVLLIRGEARNAFGEVLAEALRRRMPGIPDEPLHREREKALRAPLVVVVAASLKTAAKKIPEIEQLLSAGCVAYGITVAAQAEGFGAVWKTGEPAYDRFVHERLGLDPNDHLVGILYVGTPLPNQPDAARPAVAEHVREWTG